MKKYICIYLIFISTYSCFSQEKYMKIPNIIEQELVDSIKKSTKDIYKTMIYIPPISKEIILLVIQNPLDKKVNYWYINDGKVVVTGVFEKDIIFEYENYKLTG